MTDAATQGAEPRGLLESVSAVLGLGTEEFDPHPYRLVDKPTSYMETATHLVKGSLGAGVLAMPGAVRRLGLPAGLAGIAAVGVGATYCLQLLIQGMYEMCKRHRRGYMSYKTCMREALKVGPRGTHWMHRWVPDALEISLVVWQLGLCVVYCVSVAASIKQVLDAAWPEYSLSVRQHVLLQLTPLLLLNHWKNLKVLAPISTIANTITMLGFLLLFYYLFETKITITKEELEFKGISHLPIFVGTTLFALEAVGVILALEYSIDEPKRFCGFRGLLNRCMLGIVLLYCLVGGAGYAKYAEETKDSVVLNLPITETAAKLTMLVFSLALFLSFPLQNYVAYQIIWVRLRPRLSDQRVTAGDMALRFACVVIPWVVGVAVPHLGPVIGLFGALCLSLLGIVFPGLLDYCLWFRPPAADDWRTRRQEAMTPRRRRYLLTRDAFIIVLGMLALVAGVYTSVLDILRA